MPAIDFERSADDLEGVEIPLSPPVDPVTMTTTEPVGIPHAADVKEKSEAPQGEEKLAVQESTPVRRSKNDILIM